MARGQHYENHHEQSKDEAICELIVEAGNEMIDIIRKYGKIKQVFPMIQSYLVEIPRARVPELSRMDNVTAVYENTHVTAQMNQSRKAVRADKVRRQGYDGTGITIAFLDTGISPVEDFTFPNNRIVAFRDFVKQGAHPYDDNGHGTHVTAIAAGSGTLSGGKYMGIAPGSKIVAAKILDEEGQGNTALALQGLQWVMDYHKRYHIRITNLSIGALETTARDPLIRAVNAMWDAGIVVTVASGNNGPKQASVTSPGCSKKVITVGTIDDASEVQIWGERLVNFSGRGPTKECVVKPDLVSPGSRIVSALSPGSLLSQDAERMVDQHYARLSGTSMSTPSVAGAIALFLQKHPDAKPDEVKLALKHSAETLHYPPNQQGWGLLNIEALMQIDINHIREILDRS